MRTGVIATLVSLAFLLMLPVASRADPAITLVTYTDFTNGQWSLGFEFSPTTNIDVTALGSFFPAGATDTHGASIWTAGGTLLATTTITGTGAEGFDFGAITPLLLTAGTDYVVSATTLNDPYADQSTTFTVAPDINYIGHVETSCAGVTPCFPGTSIITGFNDFGANFQFTPAAVPEPASLMLLGTGLLGLGVLGWLKRGPVKRSFVG